MKPTQIIITAILLLAVTSTHAQKMRNKINGKLPAARTINEYQLSKERTLVKSYEKRTETFPRDIRYPGEFEESQAVFISWSYDYDDDGNVTGADVSSQYALVSARLADAIQKVVPVWIRVENASDTTAILSYMFNRGTPLTNYLFIISPGDDWWTRDFGPNGVYVGRQDSLAFIDLKYYDGRDKDNVAPTVLSNLLQVNNYTTRLNAEGGNFMSDGFGTIFYSNVVSDVNTDPQIVNPVFTLQEIKDKLTAIFGSTNNVELPTLLCDGGTGHIDLYLKMIDEQTLMVSKYPDEITAQDKRIIEDNYQYLTTLRSTYNRPFRIYRIPHPTDDNGNHSKKSCSQLNSDARTFVNGTTVNNTFIFPSYSNAGTGNKTQTDSVTKLFKQIMPGYKIVDIDSRLLSPLGGEIHCITMQIPADNPVLFWHPSVDGFQPIFKNTFPIVAKITNKSGIANAKCYWRIKGNSSFNEIVLRDSSDFFVGEIVANGISNSDVIEYYLSATTNNGKTATKPITAPDGYYSIFFSLNTALNEVAIFPKNYLFNAYPNPAKDKIIIPFNALNKADFTITITDILGKVVQTINPIDVKEGLNELILDVEQFNNGIYFYNLSVNHTILDTRKFIINK